MAFEDKSPEIQRAMAKLSPHGVSGKCCSWCGNENVAKENFANELSWKEFNISFMCQVCQDDFFSGEDDDDFILEEIRDERKGFDND